MCGSKNLSTQYCDLKKKKKKKKKKSRLFENSLKD